MGVTNELLQRMREAAETLIDVSEIADPGAKSARLSWSAFTLRQQADTWETETEQADVLAREMAQVIREGAQYGSTGLDIARKLVDQGWTKGKK